ncbi:MAG: type II toxin-antitoxin system VapC family toxin [Variibacter sp.]|nr:type II toxin-antitoxin system VapC family toxin [Variibacter sp.]
MPGFLLDTNIISDLMRNPTGRAAARLARLDPDSVFTSIIVACELRLGAQKRGSPSLTAHLEEVLASMTVLPLTQPADRHYAALRARLERLGTPIGANDYLIAAHALALDATLVTGNEREFSRVEGLRIENWLR